MFSSWQSLTLGFRSPTPPWDGLEAQHVFQVTHVMMASLQGDTAGSQRHQAMGTQTAEETVSSLSAFPPGPALQRGMQGGLAYEQSHLPQSVTP